ncbi:MAG: HAMP domain-containing protein, partial [Chloroflexi bacterium]|nr:HAMP domain-containing protein [Chloroflexota bacterium]
MTRSWGMLDQPARLTETAVSRLFGRDQQPCYNVRHEIFNLEVSRMDVPFSLSIGAFAFVSVPLFIVGLISTYYLLRFRNKTPATWFMVGGLGGLTLSMLVWFLSTALVVWGVALYPATNAAVVLAMASVIGFLYHYPQPVRSLEARLVLSAGVGLAIGSAGYSLWFAYQIASRRAFGLRADPVHESMLGAAMLLALGVTVRRAIVVRRTAPDRVRALRNMALALVFGLTQAIASGLGMSGLLPMPLDTFIIGLSLLAMEVVLVYSTWDHVVHQPGLITRLIGLSLVTVLALLGAIGLFEVHGATLDSEAARLMETEIAQRAVQAHDLTGLPGTIVSVLAVGPVTAPIYQRADQVDLAPLAAEAAQRAASALDRPVLWGSQYDYYLDLGTPRQMPHRYVGQHPARSYYQYLGYSFTVNGAAYEAVFSEAETNAPIHARGMQFIGVVIAASLFILLVFPVFFRRSLVVPLENLLRGVRQANAGDLNVRVPITHDDELGFLTQSFNTMTASIKDEIEARQAHEAALRDLTGRLEQRVADRTRDLTVLYEVTSAANRVVGLDELLGEIMSLTLPALNSTAGSIHLREDATAPLRLVARQGAGTLPPALEIFTQVMDRHEALFIPDVAADSRVKWADLPDEAVRLVLAPLATADQILGVLSVARVGGALFNVEEIALLTSIAEQVGVIVTNARLREQTALLEERQRIARDLHDSVTQSLYGLVTLTEAGQLDLQTRDLAAIGQTFDRLGETARQSLKELRLFIYQLNPPILEDEGLIGALHLRLATVEGRSDVQVRLLADETIHLPLPVETELYHIANEALNNILKHARARSITVYLSREDGHVVLDVIDDGCGFDVDVARASGGLGLKNQHERSRRIGGA